MNLIFIVRLHHFCDSLTRLDPMLLAIEAISKYLVPDFQVLPKRFLTVSWAC